jgi:beta-galactosidase
MMLFDSGWRFYRGDVERGDKPSFDDSRWRTINLPHDWSIEDLPGASSPFHPDAVTQVSGGFTTGGTAWYRKHFTISSSSKGKIHIIQFDGVYMNADIWVNGKHLGNHPYGYTSFYFDITDEIIPGGDVVINASAKGLSDGTLTVRAR